MSYIFPEIVCVKHNVRKIKKKLNNVFTSPAGVI